MDEQVIREELRKLNNAIERFSMYATNGLLLVSRVLRGRPMDEKSVLTNLKNWNFEYSNYPLRQDEAFVIIKALERGNEDERKAEVQAVETGK